MNIQIFIFNWKNQYEKTKQKEEQLKAFGKVTVINSDEEHEEPHWVNMGESAWFTDLFNKAIELFDGDVLVHIQGDASYDRWGDLFKDANRWFEKYCWGVYAPNVDYTWYNSSRTDVESLALDEDHLKIVACPDCTCWFIHKDMINQLKERKIDFTPYKMGWGWDIVLPALAYLNKRSVIRDYSHTIDHPEGTNYNKQQAEQEMIELYKSLPDDIREAFYLIKTNKNMLAKYFADEQNA